MLKFSSVEAILSSTLVYEVSSWSEEQKLFFRDGEFGQQAEILILSAAYVCAGESKKREKKSVLKVLRSLGDIK